MLWLLSQISGEKRNLGGKKIIWATSTLPKPKFDNFIHRYLMLASNEMRCLLQFSKERQHGAPMIVFCNIFRNFGKLSYQNYKIIELLRILLLKTLLSYVAMILDCLLICFHYIKRKNNRYFKKLVPILVFLKIPANWLLKVRSNFTNNYFNTENVPAPCLYDAWHPFDINFVFRKFWSSGPILNLIEVLALMRISTNSD